MSLDGLWALGLAGSCPGQGALWGGLQARGAGSAGWTPRRWPLPHREHRGDPWKRWDSWGGPAEVALGPACPGAAGGADSELACPGQDGCTPGTGTHARTKTEVFTARLIFSFGCSCRFPAGKPPGRHIQPETLTSPEAASRPPAQHPPCFCLNVGFPPRAAGLAPRLQRALPGGSRFAGAFPRGSREI